MGSLLLLLLLLLLPLLRRGALRLRRWRSRLRLERLDRIWIQRGNDVRCRLRTHQASTLHRLHALHRLHTLNRLQNLNRLDRWPGRRGGGGGGRTCSQWGVNTERQRCIGTPFVLSSPSQRLCVLEECQPSPVPLNQ